MTTAEVRALLQPYRARSTARALGILAVDTAAYAACFTAIVAVEQPVVRVALGTVLGVLIGRLFVIGHDACHGSFTASRRLNDVLARIAFLPSLTPLGPWRLGHNQTHHAYTNRLGLDYVWAPIATTDWPRTSRLRRLLERLYRMPLGGGLNYFVEIWCAYLLLPRAATRERWRAGYTADSVLVFTVAALVALLVLEVARRTHQPAAPLLFATMLWPFVVWNALMGFVIYQHHTDPDVRWYPAHAPTPSALQLDATQHVIFPGPVNALFHNIMEHTAHHADPLIPLYRLPAAQRRLRAAYGEAIRTKRWTVGGFVDTTRRCKLYDVDAHRWTDFRGQPT